MINKGNSKSVDTLVSENIDSSMTIIKLHKELSYAVSMLTGYHPDTRDRISVNYNGGIGTFRVCAHHQDKVLYGESTEKDLGLGIINAYMNAYSKYITTPRESFEVYGD